MTDESRLDPLFRALSRLTPVAPREGHDRRVLAECHKLLAEHRTRGESRAFRVADLIVAAAAVLYVIAAVSEAVRLLAATAG